MWFDREIETGKRRFKRKRKLKAAVQCLEGDVSIITKMLTLEIREIVFIVPAT